MVLLVLLYVQPCKASRVLEDEKREWRKKGNDYHIIVLQSLQRGPVTPSGPSGCTYIPGSGGSPCPVKEMNFAGKGSRRGEASQLKLTKKYQN